MKKENLIIIAGMPRAGTSYLYQALSHHPEVFMPVIKETNYFIYNKEKGLPWFESIYSKAGAYQKVFDISPLYFLDDDFFENAKAFSENQKVILLLRDPNEWVKSFYKQIKKQAYDLRNFEQFSNGYKLKFEKKSYEINFKTFDYVDKVERFKLEFGENLLLIDFAKFERDKLDILRQIEHFIGVKPFFNRLNVPDDRVNAGDVDSNKFLTYLSTISLLRNIAFKVFPHNFIHFIRNKYILGVPTAKSKSLPNIYKHKNVFRQFFEGGK